MQVFYVNIGGGEPTVRRDFWELVDYATAHHVGVKFSTNGSRITPSGGAARRHRLRRRADLARRRHRRGQRRASAAPARTPPRSARWSDSPRPGFAASSSRSWSRGRTSTSSTRSRRWPIATARSCGSRGCARRAAAPTCGTSCTRPRRSSASSTTGCSRTARTSSPATRSSTSPPTATPLPGLNLCGAGRVVCLIDPVGDVYACPFAIHEQFLAGNVREPRRVRAGLARVRAVRGAARAAARGRVRELRLVRRVPRWLHGGEVLHRAAARRPRPGVRARPRRAAARSARATPASRRPSVDHSRTAAPRARVRRHAACDESPLAVCDSSR